MSNLILHKNYINRNKNIFFIFFINLILFIILNNKVKATICNKEIIELSQLELPKSRLLFKKKVTDKKIIVKEKNKNDVKEKKINLKKKLNKENIKKKIVINEEKNKIQNVNAKKALVFNIRFDVEQEIPKDKDLEILINKLRQVKKINGITIKGYANKKKGDSTSKIRRLSLKRALYVRSILLKNNYKLSKIQVKALGHNIVKLKDKDLVIVTTY